MKLVKYKSFATKRKLLILPYNMAPKKSPAIAADPAADNKSEFKTSPLDEELGRERARLATLRSSIDVSTAVWLARKRRYSQVQSLEKTFKESLLSKRLSQNPAYTFSDELLTASDANASGSELTKGAVEELQRLKARWKTTDTQRVSSSDLRRPRRLSDSLDEMQEMRKTQFARQLDRRVDDTRKRFKRLHELTTGIRV